MPIPYLGYRPSIGAFKRTAGSLGTVAMIVVAVLSARGIATRPIGIALAVGWALCAVAAIALIFNSGEGIQRDLGFTLLCLSVGGLWVDQSRVLPVAVPTSWRVGGFAILEALAVFFAFRARRKVSGPG